MQSLQLPPASIAHQGITTHISPRLCYESVDHCNVLSGLILISSTGFSQYWTQPPGWFWTFWSSATYQLPFCDELHWLPISRRIDFKIALMVRHCMVGTVPEYLMELCHPVCTAVGRQCFRSCEDLIVPRFRLQTIGHRAFAVLAPIFGTHSRSRLISRVTIFCSSRRNWKRTIPLVLSASVDTYLLKGLTSLLYYYYYYYYYSAIFVPINMIWNFQVLFLILCSTRLNNFADFLNSDNIVTNTLAFTLPNCPGTTWCYGQLGIVNMKKGMPTTVTLTILGVNGNTLNIVSTLPYLNIHSNLVLCFSAYLVNAINKIWWNI